MLPFKMARGGTVRLTMVRRFPTQNVASQSRSSVPQVVLGETPRWRRVLLPSIIDTARYGKCIVYLMSLKNLLC